MIADGGRPLVFVIAVIAVAVVVFALRFVAWRSGPASTRRSSFADGDLQTDWSPGRRVAGGAGWLGGGGDSGGDPGGGSAGGSDGGWGGGDSGGGGDGGGGGGCAD